MICSRCAAQGATDAAGLCPACAVGGGAPVPAPSGGVLRSPVGLSYVVVALLAVVIAVDLAAVYAALNTHAVVGRILEGGTGEYADDGRRADLLMYRVASLYVTALVATGVVFIVWFRRVRGNAQVFAPDLQRRGPGWAVGAWFIPIANLWIPRQIAGDIWRASELERRASRGVLNAWWTLWVVSLAVDRIATRAWDRAEYGDDLRRAALGLVAGYVIDIAAAVLAILFVRRLTALQHAKALAGGGSRPQEPEPEKEKEHEQESESERVDGTP
ncbi:DUF4328 domain-containing protein [Streptomyces sp. TRM64462]|uniref:DUF4328 domain-containing protein n=1 Tax=Streptomyces sp. TRM64462 TaxID=2741726 RepID=UPI001586C4DB|nr:DUF4328 domain-containing protein [Streptomyces sp. TRM64462]